LEITTQLIQFARYQLCKIFYFILMITFSTLIKVWPFFNFADGTTSQSMYNERSTTSTVVALMTLTSTTEDWNISSFYENPAFVNLMSGR